MEIFIEQVLQGLGFIGTEVLKTARSNCRAISSRDLVMSILSTTNTPEAAKYLGIGEQTLNRVLAKVLIPVFGKLNGGGETWKYILLKNAQLKTCHTCNTIKPYSEFTSDKGNPDRLDALCRECKSLKNEKVYSLNKYTYHIPYILAHRAEYNARHAKRRAAKMQRTPKWANLDKIKDFYLKCPEGFHVDHIIPLQGKLVSGFHVEDNLQYLSARDNMKKGNRYAI